jgi:hypothetical protein
MGTDGVEIGETIARNIVLAAFFDTQTFSVDCNGGRTIISAVGDIDKGIIIDSEDDRYGMV